MGGPDTKIPLKQDPHATPEADSRLLERAIGRSVRQFRDKTGLTIHELSAASGISAGMLSKIEHGTTSPSLSTIQSLARALHVPVTALFRDFEESREANFVKAGQGLKIVRRGSRSGHQYRLLGHAPHGPVVVEPYLIALNEKLETFPVFQHDGLEFIYMLERRKGTLHSGTGRRPFFAIGIGRRRSLKFASILEPDRSPRAAHQFGWPQFRPSALYACLRVEPDGAIRDLKPAWSWPRRCCG